VCVCAYVCITLTSTHETPIRYHYALDSDVKLYFLAVGSSSGVAAICTLLFIADISTSLLPAVTDAASAKAKLGHAVSTGSIGVENTVYRVSSKRNLDKLDAPPSAQDDEESGGDTLSAHDDPPPPRPDVTTNVCCVGATDMIPEEDYMYADISDYTLLRLPEFWLTWVAFFCLVGPALMWKNHVGLMGLEPVQTNALVMSWVALNATTRLLVGYLCDWCAARRVLGFSLMPNWSVGWLACLLSCSQTFTSFIHHIILFHNFLVRCYVP
jgi:hypothetical protein